MDTRKAVKVSNIPISPSAHVKKRHLVSTKWIPEYNGDQKGYQFFFIPKGTLENNTATELVVVTMIVICLVTLVISLIITVKFLLE